MGDGSGIDLASLFSPAAAGQPQNVTPAPVPVAPSDVVPGGDKPANQPSYITKAEAEALITSAVEQARREAQSLTDKNATRLQAEISKRIGEVERAYQTLNGAAMPAEQKDVMRQRVINQVLSETPQDQPGSAPAQVTPSNPAAAPAPAAPNDVEQAKLAEVQRRVAEEVARYGVRLEPGDPEWNQINTATPDTFLETMPAAVAAKAQRTRNPAARLPALGSGAPNGNPVNGVNNLDQLWKIVQERGL